MGQLPLALSLDRHTRFDNFVADGNAAAVAHLRAAAAGRRSETIWLWGPPGCGKTHLLQAACRSAGDTGLRTMYIDLDASARSDALDGLNALDLLAVDGIGRVARETVWQLPLFSLFDGFHRGAGALLVAAAAPPSAIGFALADLQSRAAGAIVYRIQPLDDDGRLRALTGHAAVRGLELDQAAAAYLFTRVKRDMGELCRWLDHIDRESLAAQRRITIPFLRELVEAADGEPRGEL